MDYVRLGTSALNVSRVALGCMSFGETSRGFNTWSLGEDEAQPYLRQALDLGINFWDTANVYQWGSSEEIVGRAIRGLTRREDIVLATKVFFPMHDGPTGSGLSRPAIMENIDASLARLGTDYVDLYVIHRFDEATPIEETLEALHDVVQAGKARFLGASAMSAWRFAKMQHVAERNGWTQFVSMQNPYNLLNREEEREMNPQCLDMGVATTPYSPLARGRLARPYDVETARSASDPSVQRFYGHVQRPIVDAVESIALARGVSMATVAMAWLLAKPTVTSPIVGATKPHHLSDAVAALDVALSEAELDLLESSYTPQVPAW
jgi:1-deoxyxylulose-5-phosphate synthase